jgi:hypothetical protein
MYTISARMLLARRGLANRLGIIAVVPQYQQHVGGSDVDLKAYYRCSLSYARPHDVYDLAPVTKICAYLSLGGTMIVDQLGLPFFSTQYPCMDGWVQPR